MHAANDRYLAFMACLDNPDAAQKALAKMAAPAKVKGRSFRGFDLFLDPDYQLRRGRRQLHRTGHAGRLGRRERRAGGRVPERVRELGTHVRFPRRPRRHVYADGLAGEIVLGVGRSGQRHRQWRQDTTCHQC